MKVMMDIQRSPLGHKTKALKPLMVDERWADRIEKLSKGKIKRRPVAIEQEEEAATTRRRSNRRKTEEEL
jgi:hypothetical protein